MAATIEKVEYPMDVLRVTQGELSTYSHAGSLAMDFGGASGATNDKLYAPCTMACKRVRSDSSHEMYFESIDNVMTADGYIGIVNFTFMHDDYINSNVRQGAIIKKGEYFADEGGFGSGRVGKFSGHVHIEAGKGKSPASQKQNAQGTWCTPGQEHLYNIFFVSPNTKITGAGGYNWKRTPSSDPVPPNPVAPPQEGEIMTGNLLYLNNSRNNQIFVEPNPESTILGERDQVKPGAYVIIEAPTAGTPVADTKWAKIWYNNAVGYAVYGGMVQGGAYIMEHTDVKSMYGSPIAQSILPEVDNSATIALLQTAIEQLK